MSRRASNVLSALLLLAACTGDDGGSTSTGVEGRCSEGYGDGPEVDPEYPACDCAPEFCSQGGACLFTGPIQSSWTSSLCAPPCAVDVDCPELSGERTQCRGGSCVLPCDDSSPCPAGYTCGGTGECQVLLEPP